MAKKAKGFRKLTVSRGAADGAPKTKAKIARKRKTGVMASASSLVGAVARRLVEPALKPSRDKTIVDHASSPDVVQPPAASPARRKIVRLGEAPGRLERLESAIVEVRLGTRNSVRTRKLLASGVAKMAQKVIEEAAEAAIEAIRGDRAAFVQESVDLFYNHLALCCEVGVPLAEIWAEMDRREGELGMAEKLPKPVDG